MATTNQQLALEAGWFEPAATAHAMRDSRYRHPANAIAELIDNSIDANADRVEVLIEERQETVTKRRRWRVSEIAVLDNGHGMSAATLRQAVTFGGRSARGRVHEIGKYGMGLPTASVSQCKRVDIWTWEQNIEDAVHSYIDIDQIEGGVLPYPPEPERQQLPEKWMARGSVADRGHGTLVVWMSIDRITAQTSTIFRRLERELGRIYRHFIAEGEVEILMRAFQGRNESTKATVRPNDPLFLMSPSSTSKPWDVAPMFRPYGDPVLYSILVDGREESVEVRYSIVKDEVIVEPDPDAPAQLPGRRPYGQDARWNMGVSVIRENRELLLEDAFVREGGQGYIPENRWWGCEIRFGSGCDDAFGVDHNKQSAAVLSNAAKEMLNIERPTDEIMAELGVSDDAVYQIVRDIRAMTASLLRDIKVLFQRRRASRQTSDGAGRLTPEQDAVRRATRATEQAVSGGLEPATQLDEARHHLPVDVREQEVAAYLEEQGDPEAARQAYEIARHRLAFGFVPQSLDGHQMFSVRRNRQSGTLFVHLNIDHPLYDSLRILEDQDDPLTDRAAVAIRILLLAWARLDDLTELPAQRAEIQDVAMRWGREARWVLDQLGDDINGEESGSEE